MDRVLLDFSYGEAGTLRILGYSPFGSTQIIREGTDRAKRT